MGGVAASLLGRPRATRDVDALVIVSENRWGAFLDQGREFGFDARAPKEEALRFARETRVLFMSHRSTGIEVDLVLGSMPFEREVVSRGRTIRIARLSIRVISAEDLIIMKAAALRTRDLADIAGILEFQPRLNLIRIRRLTREFARALEKPEIVEELERLLAASPKRPRKH
jgi:hypothetical protein